MKRDMDLTNKQRDMYIALIKVKDVISNKWNQTNRGRFQQPSNKIWDLVSQKRMGGDQQRMWLAKNILNQHNFTCKTFAKARINFNQKKHWTIRIWLVQLLVFVNGHQFMKNKSDVLPSFTIIACPMTSQRVGSKSCWIRRLWQVINLWSPRPGCSKPWKSLENVCPKCDDFPENQEPIDGYV